MHSRSTFVIAFLGLLFAGLLGDCAFGGVMFGVAGEPEPIAVNSASTKSENPCPQAQASDLEDSMTGASISGVSVHASLANSNLERPSTDDPSEPMVHPADVEFPKPLAMELLKIPILIHFSR